MTNLTNRFMDTGPVYSKLAEVTFGPDGEQTGISDISVNGIKLEQNIDTTPKAPGVNYDPMNA